MPGQRVATLEIELAMATGGAVSDLNRFGGVVDKVSAQAIRDLDHIDAAMKGVGGMAGPTAEMVAFADQTARSAVSAARELNRVEKQIEGTIGALDRETAALGRTKDEMRDAKVEALALTAANLGLTEAVERLQTAARQRQISADGVAEGKAAAAERVASEAAHERAQAEAAVIAQLRERAQLEDALYRNFGVGQPSAIQSGATFSALAERERELEIAEKATQAEQGLIAAQREQNSLLAERAQIEAALARTMGTDRPRATDAGATFSALNAKAAEDEARAHDIAAAAVARDADEHARLAAIVRGSHDAQMADAAAAERLRETTDPLYAATKRLNAEIAESTRLYHAGATAPAEYARQQQVLTQRLTTAAQQHDVLAASSRRSGFAMQQFAIQLPDIAQGLLTGQKPMTVFIQQGGQLAQIGMMAEGGLKGFVKQIGALTLVAAPALVAVGAVAGVAYGALKLFQSQVKDSGDLTRFRDNLGLTHKEMLKLGDGVESAGGKIKKLGAVTVTTSDIVAGLWKTIKETAQAPVGDWSGFTGAAVDAFKKVLDAWAVVSAGITAGIYGTANAAKIIWQNFATSVGDAFYQSVNFAIAAMNKLVESGTYLLNGFIHGANKIPGLNIHDVEATKIGPVTNPYEGASSQKAADAAVKAVGDGYTKAYADAKKADADFWKQVGNNAKQNAKDRLTEEAAAIKANRTPAKPKVDHNALNAEATEAQIRNLYKLADAYGVSGAAALIAEARVKAESAAIKHGADVEAAVAQQVRLAVAERVKTAAQGTAAMANQIAIQKQVNAEIAAGNVPAALAANMVRDRLADLPLLDAAEAAKMAHDAKGSKEALAQLEAQRAATIALNDEQQKTAVKVATAAGDDQMASLQEELRLIGATNAERVKALAILKATQDAARANWTGPEVAKWITQQGEIASAEVQRQLRADAFNDSLHYQADLLDTIAANAQRAGQGMADAFGSAGRALGDLASGFAGYLADQERLRAAHTLQLQDISKIDKEKVRAQRTDEANTLYAQKSSALQINAYGDMASAAKGFFHEGSAGYEALGAAEKVFRVAQFAMSLQAMLQNALETAGVVTNAAAKATAEGAVGVAKQSQLQFPYNIIAMAATGAALVAAGIAVLGHGGGAHAADPGNTGIGTVLGDPSAKSDSIKNAIDALKEVDLLTNTYSREMAAALKSIDNQIGGVAAQIVKGGDINASAGVTEGFKTDIIGSVLSKIPLIGGILGSLFGSKTTVTGGGLYGGAQSVGSITSGGFNAQTFSDIEKTKKFLGITTGHSYSTQYGAADPGLTSQFTLLIKSFSDAIAAAAGPLGEATGAVEARLNGFVVNIGKIDLKGLTGQEIQDKLSAIFGAAADGMANAAFPGIAQFQKVGEGAFETLVRVASTIEAVGTSLDLLGTSAHNMGIAAKLGLADQFDSVSDLTSAADGYFQAFYSKEEQAAAKTAQMGKVFESLGLAMPATLTSFRQLVEAQDLTSAAGQATYATLLKLAPAFSDLQTSMEGVKSAADVASERQDLQRQLLELQGDTAAIRALDLAKLDASNRGLQEQIYAVQDAQEAAKAAADLASAWSSVGDSIMAEINRIRGLSNTDGSAGFATLMGQFNAATLSARGGDQDAAKNLPQLSKALLDAAALQATSRQELDRVQAQTAASLEATYGAIGALADASKVSVTDTLSAAATAAQATSAPTAANDDATTALRELRGVIDQMRSENNAGHAATAGNTNSMRKTLDSVTAASGGDAISVANAA